MDQIQRDLRAAFYLELFVEFSFWIALLAVGGAFNNGRPTTTPTYVAPYLVACVLVTIVVIVRTWQMIGAAQRGDLEALRRMNVRAWAIVAFFFSAMLPTIYLGSAASRVGTQSRH